MTKKQIVILVGLGVFVVVVLVVGLFAAQRNRYNPKNVPVAVQNLFNQSTTSVNPFYNPQVPADAALTKPKNAAPATPNPNLTTQIKFFEMKATKNGFLPNSITVSKGDNLQVDFTAVDGDYDLNISYLGAYFSVVKQGTTKRLVFDTSTAGTFVFECRDYCPAGGPIKGAIIVLPGK